MASTEKGAQADLATEGERWVRELVDEPLLRAAFSYGGELRLHFGKPVPYENERLAGRTHGEWTLGLRTAPWVLVSDGAVRSRSHDEQQHALQQFAQLEGKRLVDASLRRSDAALTLRFADGHWFMALTEPRPAVLTKGRKVLDLWELLTPSGLFVVARPDRSLSIEEPAAREASAPEEST
ncbi:MAG: hypothetical protein QOK16_4033 [Solirubrobacteraceae bacterium]|nr:hypothetical protein [Solirubrobacteraceae bacterium]